MWVYIENRDEPRFTVGFYDPSGAFHADSDYDSNSGDDAAERVSYLNGGLRELRNSEQIDALNDRMAKFEQLFEAIENGLDAFCSLLLCRGDGKPTWRKPRKTYKEGLGQ